MGVLFATYVFNTQSWALRAAATSSLSDDFASISFLSCSLLPSLSSIANTCASAICAIFPCVSCNPVAQVFEVDKEANIDNLKKDLEAKSSTSKKFGPLGTQEIEFDTFFINLTPKYLRVLEQKFWNGRAIVDAPDLASYAYSVPKQIGPHPQGVKWGISYTDGEGSHDTSARKWILAYDTAAKKVYAEAGPIGPIDWNVIEVKLGLSNDRVEYVDHIFGGKATAEIIYNDISAHGYGWFQ